jgi:hypothetical protein
MDMKEINEEVKMQLSDKKGEVEEALRRSQILFTTSM